MTQSSTGPGRVQRTAKHIKGSDPELCKLLVHSAGRVVGEQHGRQTVLAPGDLTLVDLSQPFRCVHGASKIICVAFPRTLAPFGPDELVLLAREADPR